MDRRKRLRTWFEDRGLIDPRVHSVDPDTAEPCARCSWLYDEPSLCRFLMGQTAEGRLVFRSEIDKEESPAGG